MYRLQCACVGPAEIMYPLMIIGTWDKTHKGDIHAWKHIWSHMVQKLWLLVDTMLELKVLK